MMHAVRLRSHAVFYDVLSGDKRTTKTFTRQIPGLGTARLRVAMAPQYASNRRVLVVRGRGMKLFLIDRFPSCLSFAGVLDLQGDALSDYYREMESAAHDKWEPNRHSGPRGAKKQWDSLRRWIRETVRELSVTSGAGEVEAVGQTSLLQSQPEDEADGPGADASGPEKGPVIEPDALLPMEPREEPSSFGGDLDKSLAPAPESADTPEAPVRLQPAHAGRTDGPDRQVRPRRTPRTRSKGGHEWALSGAESRKRVVRLAPGLFRVFLTAGEDIREGYVDLTYVGENAQAVVVNIASIVCDGDYVTFDRCGRRVRLHDVSNGQRVSFDVRVSETEDCAMKADIYARR